MTKIEETVLNMDLDVRNAVKEFKPTEKDGFIYLRTGEKNTCAMMQGSPAVMSDAVGGLMEDKPETIGIFYAAVLGHASENIYTAKSLKKALQGIIENLEAREAKKRK